MIINLTVEAKNYDNYASTKTQGFNTEYMSDIIDNPESAINGTTYFCFLNSHGAVDAYFVTDTKEAIATIVGADPVLAKKINDLFDKKKVNKEVGDGEDKEQNELQ